MYIREHDRNTIENGRLTVEIGRRGLGRGLFFVRAIRELDPLWAGYGDMTRTSFNTSY